MIVSLPQEPVGGRCRPKDASRIASTEVLPFNSVSQIGLRISRIFPLHLVSLQDTVHLYYNASCTFGVPLLLLPQLQSLSTVPPASPFLLNHILFHRMVGQNQVNGTKPNTFLFTSESVGEGHPDKICDQVSDAVLDACLAEDPTSKVACETATKTGLIMILGEISTKARLDYQKIIRGAIKDIGYDSSDKGFDYKSCNVMVCIEEQSPDIAQGLQLDEALEKLGAGDQGIMFGYATDETPEYLPLTVLLSHKLNRALKDARTDGSLPWLRPDTKTQVTVEYEHDGGAVIPKRVDTVVISAQHSPDITTELLRKEIKEKIIQKVIPAEYLDERTKYHVSSDSL